MPLTLLIPSSVAYQMMQTNLVCISPFLGFFIFRCALISSFLRFGLKKVCRPGLNGRILVKLWGSGKLSNSRIVSVISHDGVFVAMYSCHVDIDVN